MLVTSRENLTIERELLSKGGIHVSLSQKRHVEDDIHLLCRESSGISAGKRPTEIEKPSVKERDYLLNRRPSGHNGSLLSGTWDHSVTYFICM